MEFWRESRDLDGSVDWENGVVGEVRPAAVLALPLAFEGKWVESWGEVGVMPAGVIGFLVAERAM
jgi:hypothetical protein